MDMDGTPVVQYGYDAWGKPTTTEGSTAGTLGYDNPFRYRGYVYDEETGLYATATRYYDPVFGRFMNSDTVLGKPGMLLDHNLFSYCRQNPVMSSDPSGMYDPDEREYLKQQQRKAEKQILDVARKIAEAARKHRDYLRRFPGANGLFTPYLIMYDLGQQGSPVDFKDSKVWAGAFPNLPFPGNNGEDKIYKVRGEMMSASDVGNFIFGALANAYGIDKGFTLQQAGAAQLRKPEDQGGLGQRFFESQLNSLTYEHYGDDEDDQHFIGAGYDWFSMD